MSSTSLHAKYGSKGTHLVEDEKRLRVGYKGGDGGTINITRPYMRITVLGAVNCPSDVMCDAIEAHTGIETKHNHKFHPSGQSSSH